MSIYYDSKKEQFTLFSQNPEVNKELTREIGFSK